MKDLFLLTLSQMPLMFTSSEFSIQGRKNGIPDRMFKQGKGGYFLHRHCDQYLTNKTWQKRIKQNQIITQKENSYSEKPIVEKESPESLILNEEICIKFLKEKGYKILKYTEI